MRKRLLTGSLILLVFFNSCKKSDFQQAVAETPVTKSNEVTNSPARIDTYTLDWENIDYMPMPSGQPAVFVPWASGASRQFTADLANDYKKSDGWELVYNTFNTTTLQDKLYFILYNKYRGILRMYYYLPSTTNLIPSSNIVHKLAIEGSYAASSPMMNLAGTEIADYGTNVKFASAVEQWQVAPATWYLFEYELAYDKNMSTKSFSTLNFIWPITTNQITQVNIQGKIEGTLTGNISVPGVDLTISPSFTNNRGSINIKGDGDVEKVKPSISTQLYDNLKGLVTKNLTSVAGGLIENVLGGIFGGKKDANADNVNLKINATVGLTGTLTSNVLLSSTAFSVPGYDQTNTPGFAPAYNNPLGVYYISSKPTVIETIHNTTVLDANGNPIRQYVYEPDPSSFSMDFNPAVLTIADIANIKYEVVASYYDGYGNGIVGKIETIGYNKYLTGTSIGITSNAANLIGLRVSFDVVPKNGNPKSVIVKTFAVNKTTVEVNNPPGEEEW
jgi:hypothetical protein